jgi:hypothetical protein
MQRRSRAALIALTHSDRAPPDLVEEIARAMFDRPTERFRNLLRRIDPNQVAKAAMTSGFQPPRWAPVRSLIFENGAQTMGVTTESGARWCAAIERCDDDLCRWLTIVGVQHNAIKKCIGDVAGLCFEVRELMASHNREFLQTVPEILCADVVEYLGVRITI